MLSCFTNCFRRHGTDYSSLKSPPPKSDPVLPPSSSTALIDEEADYPPLLSNVPLSSSGTQRPQSPVFESDFASIRRQQALIKRESCCPSICLSSKKIAEEYQSPPSVESDVVRECPLADYDQLEDPGTIDQCGEQRAVKSFSRKTYDACMRKWMHEYPGLKALIKDSPDLSYKQFIAWLVRCGMTGGFWTAGFTAGAILDGANSSTAGQSKLAWVCAGTAMGFAEMLCVTFICHYLSDPEVVFESNSNLEGLGRNLKEGAFWGLSCAAGIGWQPAVNQFCSADELSEVVPLKCMLKVGAATGVSFGAILACLKALQAVADAMCKKSESDYGHFRPFTLSNTVSDSVLFAWFIVGLSDAFFVLTSTQSVFNHQPYSTSAEYELTPVLTQIGLSACSTMLGGLVGYALRAVLSGTIKLADNRGQVLRALSDYRRELSLNSQCVIL